MTALCPGGGPSSPDPGRAAVVQYSSGLVASIFAAYDLAWLIPIIPLLSFGNQVLATFCASDPPAIPTFTTAETDALLNLDLTSSSYFSGLSKFGDLVQHLIWYDSCHCDSGTAVAVVAPSPPAGTPINQPPRAPANTSCKTLTITESPAPGISNFNCGGFTWRGYNVTTIRITATNTSVAGSNITATFQLQWDDGRTPNDIGTPRNFVVTNNATVTFLITPPPGADDTSLLLSTAGSGSFSNLSVFFEAFCDGAVPGGTQQPCCPPDTATQAYLDIILKQVNLIQRQSVPFAYVYGANHPGLTGSGSIPVSGLIGVSVDVTVLPASTGNIDGVPVEYFDLGFVTLGTADGWGTSRRIDHNGSLILPSGAAAYTSIGYTLPPGVTVAIRELVREP